MPNGRKGAPDQKKKQGAATCIGYEAELRQMSDTLRGSADAAACLPQRDAYRAGLEKGPVPTIICITTPATPLHGSAPGGLLFSGADK